MELSKLWSIKPASLLATPARAGTVTDLSLSRCKALVLKHTAATEIHLCWKPDTRVPVAFGSILKIRKKIKMTGLFH